MTQIELACTYCPPLTELIEDNDAPIERIEVGPWYSPDEIVSFQESLPDWKFHIHDSNLHSTAGLIPGALDKLRRYHEVTDSPWASLHITLILPGMVRLLKRGFPILRPSNAFMTRRLIQQVKAVQEALDKPVILENMCGFPKHHPESEPELIRGVIEETDCGMLLDLGHARIGASYWGIDIHDYLSALPLKRIRQLHLHSPGIGKSRQLEDLHEPMTELDYALLEWLLERSQPELITLEYWRDKDAMREQLYRIKELTTI